MLKLIIILLLLLTGFTFFIFLSKNPSSPKSPAIFPTPSVSLPSPSPSESPKPLAELAKSVPPSDAYTIIIVGDSMTQLLGENADYLRQDLKTHYPKKVFGIFNYGKGSTSILSVEDRLNNIFQFYSKDYPPILKREFDLILIESFGNNPLSEYPLEEGLKKQTEELDKIVIQLRSTHPKSVIAFIATVAPLKENYGKGSVDLSTEKRVEWSNERTAYIQNHIKYANDHGIYLVNIFDKSLKSGEGDQMYINTTDHIHPSPTGLQLIAKSIADFIYQNKILPP